MARRDSGVIRRSALQEKFKHRLIGAIVLMALAVIFVPMIFSGSETERRSYTTDIPPAPGITPAQSISVLDLKAEMQARRRDNTATLPVEIRDDTDYAQLDDPILDQNGLPIGWSLQVASFRDRENALNLRRDIRSLGHGGYVLKSHTNEGLFYQVLVGPSLDRTALMRTGEALAAQMDLAVQIVRYRVEDDRNQVGG